MKYILEIQNLKCGGCVNTITKELNNIEGIQQISIDKDNSTVSFETDTSTQVEVVKQRLSAIGYPEVGDDNSLIDKAKSYVSCAIGRMG
jgi:copper chaperone CopZ